MSSLWKPRHVATIAAILAVAAVAMPAAVEAVDPTQVQIVGADASHVASVDEDGALQIFNENLDRAASAALGDGIQYGHVVLTTQNPVAVVIGQPDATQPWAITSLGLTALPTTKGATYVTFRHINRAPGTEQEAGAPCSPIPTQSQWLNPPADLPALWVQPHSQSEYTFAPRILFDMNRWHCLVATLVTGGPVDAHATATEPEGNF